MDTNVSTIDGRSVIKLQGRFDFNAHREFREAVEKAMLPDGIKDIQVDLANVAYLDSSALGMLLMLRDKAQGKSRTVSLVNSRGSVKQVLEIANFGKLFLIS